MVFRKLLAVFGNLAAQTQRGNDTAEGEQESHLRTASWVRVNSKKSGWERALKSGLKDWQKLPGEKRVAELAAIAPHIKNDLHSVRQDAELERSRVYRMMIAALQQEAELLQPDHWMMIVDFALPLRLYQQALDAGNELCKRFPAAAKEIRVREALGIIHFHLDDHERARAYLDTIPEKKLSAAAKRIRSRLELAATLIEANTELAKAFKCDRDGAKEHIGRAIELVYGSGWNVADILPKTLDALLDAPPSDSSSAIAAETESNAEPDVIPVFCSGFQWSGASAVRDFLLEQRGAKPFWNRARFMHGSSSTYDKVIEATSQRDRLRLTRAFIAEQFLGISMRTAGARTLQVYEKSLLSLMSPGADLSALDEALSRFVRQAIEQKPTSALGRSMADVQQHLCRLCHPTARYMLFDSVIRAWTPDLIADISGARMVVVIRDPRDMYATHVDRGRWKKGVDVYIEELRKLLEQFERGRPLAEATGRLRFVQFEDFVTQPQKRAELLEWLGMDAAGAHSVGKFFDPEKSKENIGVYQSFADQAAIEKIEKAFPDLCIVTPASAAKKETRPPADPDIRVMTFSAMATKRQQQDLMKLAGKPGEPGWKVRRFITVDMIEQGQYDFFGLQHCHTDTKPEYNAVGFFQSTLLERGIDYGVLNHSGKSNPQIGDSTPLFYRRDRWRPVEGDQGMTWFDVPVPEDQPGGGGLFYIYCLFNELNEAGEQTGRQIFVCNVRLRDKHTDVLDLYRLRCLAILFKEVERRRSQGLPVIVLADTNCKVVDSLSDRFMRGQAVSEAGETFPAYPEIFDALLSLHPEMHGTVRTQHNFKKPGNISGSERNDRIFFSGPLAVQTAEIVTFNKDGNFPSYHYPIAASFSFKAESATQSNG